MNYPFYFENKYYATDLEPAWNQIPNNWKQKLEMELEGGAKLTGWDQFITLYDGRVIAYNNLEPAKKRFIYIFMSNTFILEQIGKLKESITGLTNLENWKNITVTSTVGNIETNMKSSAASSNKSNSTNTSTNKLGIKRTDSNSYLIKEGEIAPFNQLENQDNLISTTSKDDTQNLNYSVNDSNTDSKSASKVETTNRSRDYYNFLGMEIKNLYDRFWKQFTCLFLFNY